MSPKQFLAAPGLDYFNYTPFGTKRAVPFTIKWNSVRIMPVVLVPCSVVPSGTSLVQEKLAKR
jgi:hypothetical protein